jgi:RES domain-containing protein
MHRCIVKVTDMRREGGWERVGGRWNSYYYYSIYLFAFIDKTYNIIQYYWK